MLLLFLKANNSMKDQTKCQLNPMLCCFKLVVPSCLRGYFARSVLDRWLERRVKKIDNVGSTQPRAGDLVFFKLELTPNQRNCHLKNTSVQSIGDFPHKFADLSFILPRKAILKSVIIYRFLNMIGARNQTKEIRSI